MIAAPAAATGPARRPQDDAGFSLVEMMVVILIIAMMTSVAMLSLSFGSRDRARLAATQLAGVLRSAREEAAMQGRNLAFGFWQHGWTCYELDAAGAWQPLQDDRLLRPRTLDDGLALSLRLQGEEVRLAARAHTHPQVFVLSSGEMEPFVLELREDARTRARLTGSALGRITLEDAHAR